jgi:transposase
MKAYLLDLRTKVVESVRRRGVSISKTARRFGVNRSTVRRYLKRLDENSSLAPKKAPGSRSKLDGSVMWLLKEDIESRPWATHKQRSQFLFVACGVEVSETTICRAIKKRLAHSRKKDLQEPVRETSGSEWCGVLWSVASTAVACCSSTRWEPTPRYLPCMTTRPVGREPFSRSQETGVRIRYMHSIYAR